jgi:hypothetical protein
MQAFTLPAGCRMRFTATAEPASQHRHRWALSLFDGAGGPDDGDAGLRFGSQIGGGENQRIETAERDVDRLCKLTATHQTVRGWEPDLAEVLLDTPDALTIAFHRPAAGGGATKTEECVLAFQFSPAIDA